MTSGYRRLPLREPAAVHRDERGFTVVEVMVALFILSIGLVSLAYTASIGFGYTARARIRSDATALANQTLEQTRGLSREVLARGMSTDDLAGDPNIVNCNAGTKKCYSVSNEVLVHSPGTPSITPVNPHVSTVEVGPTTFTRRVYLTYLDTSTNATRSTNAEALHIMVVVSWPSGGGGPAGSIALDSIVENTSGCPAVDLHPFGGPCADYIRAEAEIPAGTVTIRPASTGVGPNSGPFSSVDGYGLIASPKLKVALGSEQAMLATTSLTTSGVQKVTLTGGSLSQATTGMVSDSASASNGNGVPETELLSLTDTSSAGTPLQIGPAGGIGHEPTLLLLRKVQTDSPILGRASTHESCVTPADIFILGCAYAADSVRDGSWTSSSGNSYSDASVANLVIQYKSAGVTYSLGDCRAVHTDTGAGASTVYVHRTASPTQVELVMVRRLPRMALGCIPSGITRPAGYDDARGLLQLRGLVETATVAIGSDSLSATVDRQVVSTTTDGIFYYDQATGTYKKVTMPAADTSATVTIPAVNVLTAAGSVCWTFNEFTIGKDVAQTVSGAVGDVASTGLVPPLGGLTLNVKAKGGVANCTSAPVDLDLTVALGTARISATYTPGAS